MDHFNLDQLEKKTPYTLPNNFFDEMQKNVLAETVNKKKEAKVINLNFKWMAAATITLVAGLSAFWMTEAEFKDKPTITVTDSVYQPKQNIVEENQANEQQALAGIQPIKSAKTTPIKEKKTATPEVVKSPTMSIASNKTKKVATETRLNQSLAAFSSAEISEIERSIEQDVYLDLYN